MSQVPANGGGDNAPAPLLYSMKAAEETAAVAVQSQVAADAAAAPSGEAAVAASVEQGELQRATVMAAPQQNLRYVAGHTFTYQGNVESANHEQLAVWVDTTFEPTMQVEEVAFASTRYFELAQQPDLAEIFALSPEVVVVTSANQAIHVSATQSQPTAPDSPLATPTPIPTADATAEPTPTPTSEHGWWENLWGWVTGK